MADKKKNFVGLRLSDDDMASLERVVALIHRQNPFSDDVSYSEAIRLCIRIVSARDLV